MALVLGFLRDIVIKHLLPREAIDWLHFLFFVEDCVQLVVEDLGRGLIQVRLLLVVGPVRIGVNFLHQLHRGLVVAALLLHEVQAVLRFAADRPERSAALLLQVLLVNSLEDLSVIFEVFW